MSEITVKQFKKLLNKVPDDHSIWFDAKLPKELERYLQSRIWVNIHSPKLKEVYTSSKYPEDNHIVIQLKLDLEDN